MERAMLNYLKRFQKDVLWELPPWTPQLSNEKIWKVLAFMETLPKTSQPGVGAPNYRNQP